MEKPKKRKKVTMNQVAKAYKKGVKTTNQTVAVQNYQTGTNAKMDKLVNARMGMKVPAGSAYTGPVKVKKTSVKYNPKPMRTIASGTTGSGKVRVTEKKRSL
jgi:hypothetical protein